jgi:ribosomal protein S18 acetylase RimI-like enzyme
MRPPNGVFLIAVLHDDPIACGALKVHGDEPAEIKRMWVSQDARGLGVARRLLGELEARAAARGSTSVRLDTNATLIEAIGLYRSTGYLEIAAFNDEPYADHWFEKRLSTQPDEPPKA